MTDFEKAGVATAGLAVALSILALFPPLEAFRYWDCPFHRFTGLLCPGCGGTRALYQLLHGHLHAALELNPLAVVVIFCAGAFFVWQWIQLIRGGRFARFEVSRPVSFTLLAVVFAFMVVRNLEFL